jgi:predicted lipase
MNNFVLKTAIAAARLVERAYAGEGINVVSKTTDTQVRVEEFKPGRFAITFPGTASPHDWLTDIKIRKATWLAGRAHCGFIGARLSVGSEIGMEIRKADSVLVNGHSLGGALATLEAHTLHEMGIEIEGVYTFGSPRVFNGPASRDYNRRLASRTFRIVNAGDPVPHMPWVFGTYRHVDSLVYLTRAGGIETNFLIAAAKEIGARNAERQVTLDELGRGTSSLISIGAHSIDRYIKKLEALV